MTPSEHYLKSLAEDYPEAAKHIAALEERCRGLETEARNYKTAMEANRDAAMGYQDRALVAEKRPVRVARARRSSICRRS